MTVALTKPKPMVAAVREVRGQLVSGMAVAPPARGHALLPPSDCWPQVCARSAGASALLKATVFHGDAGTLWTEIPVGTHSFSTSVNMIYGDINADNMITIDPQQSGSDRFLFDLALGAKVQMQLPTGTDKSPYLYSEVADLDRDNDVDDDDNDIQFAANLYQLGASGANLL